jgi:hypothetical protein
MFQPGQTIVRRFPHPDRAFPFDGTHLAFRPPSDWLPSELPPWWDAVPA